MGMDKALEQVIIAGAVIIGSAAVGWLTGLLLPVFFQNSTGQIQNQTLNSLNANGTIQMAFIVVGLFVGVIVLIMSARHSMKN